jgi:hypothetical protein
MFKKRNKKVKVNGLEMSDITRLGFAKFNDNKAWGEIARGHRISVLRMPNNEWRVLESVQTWDAKGNSGDLRNSQLYMGNIIDGNDLLKIIARKKYHS